MQHSATVGLQFGTRETDQFLEVGPVGAPVPSRPSRCRWWSARLDAATSPSVGFSNEEPTDLGSPTERPGIFWSHGWASELGRKHIAWASFDFSDWHWDAPNSDDHPFLHGQFWSILGCTFFLNYTQLLIRHDVHLFDRWSRVLASHFTWWGPSWCYRLEAAVPRKQSKPRSQFGTWKLLEDLWIPWFLVIFRKVARNFWVDCQFFAHVITRISLL